MNSKVAEGVFWIGHVDWPVRNFHGYETVRGSTYNAYIVLGEKIALIDAVKVFYGEEHLRKVAEIAPLEKVDYIVCNHAEPDHSGSLPLVVSKCVNATVVCNAKCRDALSQYYDTAGWRFQIVADGEKLDLGGKTLQFFNTPMVHWPESMATFVQEDGVLFSMDAFGQHYASPFRFDDELDMAVVMQEAKTYYANIVMPYGKPVAAALARLGALPLRIVAPSHGVIWRSHFDKIVAAYKDWMACKPANKVVIIYSTMWGSSKKMANAIFEGATSVNGVDVRLLDLDAVHDTVVATEAMDAKAIVAGTPTLNQGMMPRISSTLTYLKGLRPTGKKGFTFGSFGWASKGAEEVQCVMQGWGVEMVRPPLTCKFNPTEAVLAECREAGRSVASL